MRRLFVLAAAGALLAATNPGRQAYLEWLTARAGATDPLTAAIAEGLLSAATTRSNYGIFSIYTTRFPSFSLSSPQPSFYSVGTIGILGQFVVLWKSAPQMPTNTP